VARSNRLAKENSPYLLQHAQNPVDWYPWSEEAFLKAVEEDKPVFLSIGYSTCHWCHVMERESFEDEEVAEILNENFVSIKVDREERPDIDKVYMKICALMTGGGGWPLTIMMTPQKKPFFAGTYLSKKTRVGMMGLVDLLRNVAELWEKERIKLTSKAENATGYLIDYVRAKRQEEELTEIVFDEAFIRLLDSFDQTNAGFGTSPKFPSPHNLLFLLRYWKRRGRQQALEMVEKTLRKMRLGGIFDQVGFGFHRYSTDSRWLFPHFEKMLYDQAMMAIAYTETYQATGKEEYQETAEEIFDYVLRDLTNPKGGFFSAEDADSEGQEGRFYVWTEEEIKQILGEDADLAIVVFNTSRGGNYYDEVHRARTGNNILHLSKPLIELSLDLGVPFEDLTNTLRNVREKLFEAREARIHPLKDDKILTDWNGLMIAALAKGAQVFNSIRLSKAAEDAVGFILHNLQDDGRLIHTYRSGEAKVDGNLDDYAFLVWGLIELYEATFNTKYLEEALRLQDVMFEHFWDNENGGFFFKSDDSEKLLIRHKEFRDGAIPSGNSVALLNLIRLARMTGKNDYEEHAATLARVFSAHKEGAPLHNTMFSSALDFFLGPTYEIAIVEHPSSEGTESMLQAIRTRFVPNKVMLLKQEDRKNLENLAPFTKNMKTIDNKTTVYICSNFVCKKPMTEIEDVLNEIIHTE